MTLKWSNGGPKTFTTRFVLELERDVKARAQEMMAELAEEGATAQAQALLDAHTKTGEARVAAGGRGPGRDKTGTMIDAITSESSTEGDIVTAAWGWSAADVRRYFLVQDGVDAEGNSASSINNVPAANSLAFSQAKMTQQLIKRVSAEFGD